MGPAQGRKGQTEESCHTVLLVPKGNQLLLDLNHKAGSLWFKILFINHL